MIDDVRHQVSHGSKTKQNKNIRVPGSEGAREEAECRGHGKRNKKKKIKKKTHRSDR